MNVGRHEIERDREIGMRGGSSLRKKKGRVGRAVEKGTDPVVSSEIGGWPWARAGNEDSPYTGCSWDRTSFSAPGVDVTHRIDRWVWRTTIPEESRGRKRGR